MGSFIKKEYGNKKNNTILHKVGEKGFSLVEILVALTILLIIATAFLSLYTQSYLGIAYSGHKNKALYEAQQEIEELILSNESDGKDELEIIFPGLEHSIKIRGKVELRNVQYGEKSASVAVFIPNRGEGGG